MMAHCAECFVLNCLQLICGSDSPVTVTPVSSPASPSFQGLNEGNISKLSAKNSSEYADWKRCAKEFSGNSEWKTVHVGGKQWRKIQPLFRGANARHQPKAKKRLASTLASEVLPSNLPGKYCF